MNYDFVMNGFFMKLQSGAKPNV